MELTMRTGRRLAPIVLSAEEQDQLTAWARQGKQARTRAFRARIILAGARGVSNSEAARRLHTSQQTVGKWRSRFIQRRLDGLRDDPRPGAPPRLDEAGLERLIATTINNRPRNGTRWSTRTLARKLGVSQSTVSRTWRALGLQPHRAETFRLSTDPKFADAVRDISGLYLNPPVNAMVLSVDEKSPLQARRRRPAAKGGAADISGRRGRDAARTGRASLFALLKIATTEVIGQPRRRPRTGAFVAFLRAIDAMIPEERHPHLILDDPATHQRPSVKAWLARHPRFRLHVMPTPATWLDQVERWYAALSARGGRRGTTVELRRAVQRHLDVTREQPRPFAWPEIHFEFARTEQST